MAVVKQPSSVIKANDSLNITCTASGVGLVSVTWSKESDGGQLTNGNDHSVTTSEQYYYYEDLRLTVWPYRCGVPE